MKQTLILALVGVANSLDADTYKYLKYLAKFNKNPNSMDEFNMRMKHFLETDALIEEWSADPTNTSSVAHNLFSDWTKEEKAKLTSLKSMRAGT